MNRASASRDEWHPQSMEDRDAVLRELERILASPQFSSSKRYPALLQYVVKNTLDGKSYLLKERTLGVEVFDRPPTYDTNADTVVRYTAGEVRKRLLLYYHEQGRNSRIRISLPAGSYVPEFLHEPEDKQETRSRSSLCLRSSLTSFASLRHQARCATAPAAAIPTFASSRLIPDRSSRRWLSHCASEKAIDQQAPALGGVRGHACGDRCNRT